MTGTVCEELPLHEEIMTTVMPLDEESIVTLLTTVLPLHEKIIVTILTTAPRHEDIIIALLTTVPLHEEIFFAILTTVLPLDEEITGSTATAVRTSSTATAVPTSNTATAVLTSKEACTRPRHRRLKKQQQQLVQPDHDFKQHRNHRCHRRRHLHGCFPDAVTTMVLPESAALTKSARVVYDGPGN